MRTIPRNAGFSLIEVMCAILILGVAMVGLTTGLTTALSCSKDSELQTGAALIAAGQIETLRAEGFIFDGESEGECDETSLYRWKQSVTKTDIDGLHDVEVTVENANSGKTIYELRTLIFDAASTTDEEANKKDSTKSKKKERKKR